ncbi:MAG TPA: hypothetical protein VGR37_18905 [Longimicrobiaceae bacterium]|nr:hypothetical protein [Longimicrobiaceae bacterium]
MKASVVCAAALWALAAAFLPAAAQTSADPFPADSLQELRRADGSREVGRVVEVRGDTIRFETISGEFLDVRGRFVRVRPVRGRIVEGVFWEEDKHTTRLFFAPTGRTLREGAGYGGVFLFLPFVGYGATDGVTLAGGIPWIGGSLRDTPAWIAPKVRVLDRPGAQVSTGVFAIRLPGDNEEYCAPYCGELREAAWHGVAYAVGTFGSSDDALHAGAGVYRTSGRTEVPVMVGGERRVSRRNKLITENWLIPGDGGAGSVGIRRLGDRWTVDYGLMFIFGEGAEDMPYFPILSFSYAFGGGR